MLYHACAEEAPPHVIYIRGQRTRSGEGSTSLGRRETFREARRRLPCLTIKGLGLRTRLAYGGRVVFWLHRRDSRTHLHAMRAVHATCNRDRPAPDLVASIRTWITNWNDNPKPFVWHKSADQILDSLAAYCQRINDSGH